MTAKLILCLFPNPKGFGFAVMENAYTVKDCQAVQVYPMSNQKILKRVREFFETFKPELVVLENYKGKQSRKSKRVQKLIDRITDEARKRSITVSRYSRAQIRQTFRQFNAYNKHEISEAIADSIPDLKYYLRPKRLFYKPEPHTMGLFDAVSLGVTHYYLTD